MIMREIPELYAVARKITLDAGFDYTDPRTGETTKAKRKRQPAVAKRVRDRLRKLRDVPARRLKR
jgi:hypothetical protein